MDNAQPQLTAQTKAARWAWKLCPMPGAAKGTWFAAAVSMLLSDPHPAPSGTSSRGTALLLPKKPESRPSSLLAQCAASQEDRTCSCQVLKVPETSSVSKPSPPHQPSHLQSQEVWLPSTLLQGCAASQTCLWPPYGSSELLDLTSFRASLFSMCHLSLQDV